MTQPLAIGIPSELDRVRQRLTLAEPPGGGLRPGWRLRVRRVVLLQSSSRGGSSLLAEMLRQSEELLHLPGELNPCLRLAGLGYPASGEASDALSANHAYAAEELEALLSREIGRRTRLDLDAVDAFSVAIYRRLTMQWPATSFDLGRVRDWVVESLAVLGGARNWRPEGALELARFHSLLLERVCREHPQVSPLAYDMDEELARRWVPSSRSAPAPERSCIVEEAPFITIPPWKPATESDVATKTLILKTPSNAYRTSFLRSFFPKASVRVLHLTRNVAAAVNGLRDGWLHRSFASHHVGALRIRGYSDQASAAANRFWKFCLPPGWEDYRSRTLEEVCAYQWRRAHETILDETEGLDAEHCIRLKFEELVGTPAERRRSIEALSEWLGLPLEGPRRFLLESERRPVMATFPPAPRRFVRILKRIAPILEEPAVRRTMRRMGYGSDPATWR